MKVKLTIALAVSLLASGCANFRAVSEFSQRTTQVTAVVRAEVAQLDSICREQAELTIVVNRIQDEGPLVTCKAYRDSQGRLMAVALDVLDDYATALAALAENRSFDLRTDVDEIGAKIEGLKDAGGNALAGATEAAALTRLAGGIADAVTQSQRKKAVARLVEEKPNLEVTGKLLRSFFARDPDAPAGRAEPPYTNIVRLTADALRYSDRTLATPQFQAAEPIRSFELTRASAGRRRQLEARRAEGQVPAAVVTAIDSWLASLRTFAAEALEPETGNLLRQLRDVRSKAMAAKAALEAANDN